MVKDHFSKGQKNITDTSNRFNIN